MDSLAALLASVDHHPPAAEAEIALLQHFRSWLPPEYLACLRVHNGVEGYIGGGGYLRLWTAQEAIGFNQAYNLAEFLPTVFLFGTDAAAIGYGFDDRRPGAIVSVEMAALDDEYLTVAAPSLKEFMCGLAAEEKHGREISIDPPTWLLGHVIHEKHPVVLGGPVDDPSNRVLVPVARHPQLAVFFARTLRAVRDERSKGR